MRNRWMTWVLCIISILGISTTGIIKAEAFSQEIWQEEKDKGKDEVVDEYIKAWYKNYRP